mmetsp:Transcript_6711/g.25155  ORF Transcript_6711/g.25155 Transcript_6711/m.25155 type:complete len:221 (+) Transcript_6711:1123-1785(+)
MPDHRKTLLFVATLAVSRRSLHHLLIDHDHQQLARKSSPKRRHPHWITQSLSLHRKRSPQLLLLHTAKTEAALPMVFTTVTRRSKERILTSVQQTQKNLQDQSLFPRPPTRSKRIAPSLVPLPTASSMQSTLIFYYTLSRHQEVTVTLDSHFHHLSMNIVNHHQSPRQHHHPHQEPKSHLPENPLEDFSPLKTNQQWNHNHLSNRHRQPKRDPDPCILLP